MIAAVLLLATALHEQTPNYEVWKEALAGRMARAAVDMIVP